MHAKRVCKDLYLKSNTFLLANVFGNCRKICLEIYQLDAAKFLSAPVLTWQAAYYNY